MGNALSQPMSMNIAPVPTVSLINKQRCRQNQGSVVSVDYYSHSINDSLESSYDRSPPGSGLTARGPLTPSPSHSSSREASCGEVRDPARTRGGNGSEQVLSTPPTRTQKRSQDEILSVPAQKVRNFHETNNDGELLGGVYRRDAPDLNSQPVQESVIAWVNVDLIMHSYGKNVGSHESAIENLHTQSNQSAEATDPHCESAKDKLGFGCDTGCFSVQVSGEFGTGQFTVEQRRGVEDGQGSSECYHELFSSENSDDTTAEAAHICSASRGFSMTSPCTMDVYSGEEGAGRHSYDEDSQSHVYSFGPLSGANTTSVCLSSVHAGDTSSFSATDDKQENSYDSQIFNAFYQPGLCNTLAFTHDFMQDSMRSDVSMNSASSLSAGESSPPANVYGYLLNTADNTSEDRHHFEGTVASCIANNDQQRSIGFLPCQVDRPQTSFGGGETMWSLAQEGLTSLGFSTNRVGRGSVANNGHSAGIPANYGHSAGIPGGQEALPERLDSFQSIPVTSLMSSRLEALTCIPAQTKASQPCTDIKPDSKHSDAAPLKEPIKDEDVSAGPAPCPPLTLPTSCPNSSDHLPSDDEPDSLANSQMRQGCQGGPGKRTGMTPNEDDDRCDSLNIPSSSLPPFAQDPVDDNEPADSNNNLQIVQSDRSSPTTLNFAEPANDALSIFDGPNGNKQYYTAFLCCAPEDLQNFGLSFHAQLEDWGFKIFLPPRDLVLTGCNFDNMSRALEERCNGKIIVILSVNYEKSEECSFLTSFARVLDPDARKRNIIPVQIDKAVPIKNVLKGLSIIRYNHDYKCGWLKRKLVDAISA